MKNSIQYFRYFLLSLWLMAFCVEALCILKNVQNQSRFAMQQDQDEDEDLQDECGNEKDIKIDLGINSPDQVEFDNNSTLQKARFPVFQHRFYISWHGHMIDFPPEA